MLRAEQKWKVASGKSRSLGFKPCNRDGVHGGILASVKSGAEVSREQRQPGRAGSRPGFLRDPKEKSEGAQAWAQIQGQGKVGNGKWEEAKTSRDIIEEFLTGLAVALDEPESETQRIHLAPSRHLQMIHMVADIQSETQIYTGMQMLITSFWAVQASPRPRRPSRPRRRQRHWPPPRRAPRKLADSG